MQGTNGKRSRSSRGADRDQKAWAQAWYGRTNLSRSRSVFRPPVELFEAVETLDFLMFSLLEDGRIRNIPCVEAVAFEA